ncbi:FitA-like ribbon-helix-helix domain-containing protein [Pseudomonas sp. TH41]
MGNLEHQLYEQLRIAADRNGRSMEEEARLIRRFGADTGVELELPSR